MKVCSDVVARETAFSFLATGAYDNDIMRRIPQG